MYNDEFLALVERFESRQISEDELSETERNALIEYYIIKNEELDKDILYKKAVLKNVSSQLTKAYKKAISLKEKN